MARFPTAERLAELGDAARAADVAAAAAGATVTVQHTVTGPGGDVTWHVLVGPNGVEVVPGPAPAPDVVLVDDEATARAVAAGQLTPAGAFAAGRLRVGGRVGLLVEHHEAIRAAARALAGAPR